MNKGKQLIKQFEGMTQLAELKALSDFSLGTPLNDEQFNRMMFLKKEVGL